ncbi:MAG: PKD domain-containing protein [Flavitalea sp.]
MKANNSILIFLSLIIVSGISCKKESGGSGTKAVFSYVADGFIANFKDYSTNPKEYLWDFGDSSATSTSPNPVHIYHSKGDFLATLTIKNGEETSSFTDTVYIAGPNIKIDGDFTDWTYVDYTTVNEMDAGNSLLAIKTFATAGSLNFYIEGTENMEFAVMDMFIDADNNSATGHQFWMYPAASGSEYLLEGSPVDKWGSIYLHSGGDNDGWSWDTDADFEGNVVFSDLKNADGKKIIEFSIKREALGTQQKFVNFAIHELDAGYSIVGSIPAGGNPESAFGKIKL